MIDFPSSPTNGQTFTSNNITYTWVTAKSQWQASANGAYFIGTTQNYFGRASGSQTLTGVSIDGNNINSSQGITDTSGSGGALRLTHPGGASSASQTSAVTGAIKITLPQSWTNTMMRMTVRVYTYDGLPFDIYCGGYNYAPSTTWVNIFAYMDTQSRGALNVRFGHDGTYCCIYIGETSTVWAYPQVFVTDFEGGYSNFSSSLWNAGWSISYATTFGTITGTTTASLPLNSSNYNSYALPLSGGTLTGTLTSTSAGSTTAGSSQLYLNGATNNRIDFNTNGVAPPTFTTRSAGTKILYYPAISGSQVDYAAGIDGSTLWNSIPGTGSSFYFKWYAGTTNAMQLTGDGNLSVGGPFIENSNTITSNYTITSGKNAMSAGPITIANGVTVTIPDGSSWTIV